MKITPTTTDGEDFTITVSRFEAYELAWGARELAAHYTDRAEPCETLGRNADKMADTILDGLHSTCDNYTTMMNGRIAALELVN